MAPRPYFNEKGEVVPFAELMRLEKIDERTFRSTVRAYAPTGGENGAYGGHVYSQAVWAAAQTVKEGFIIHNVTGWFTLGGIPREHFVYSVHNVRDGGNYCTRSVTVTQIAEKGVCFTCTCSFKRAEASTVSYQDRVDLKRRFQVVLKGKGPFDHPVAPSQDSIWFRETYLRENPNHFNPVGGLHLQRVNMSAYNDTREPIDRRQLIFYSLRGSLPTVSITPPSEKKKPLYSIEANLHAIAHLYASDRNSLFIIPNHLSLGDKFTRMASLSHTVIFHVGVDKLLMANEPADRPPNDIAPTEQSEQSAAAPDRNAKLRKWYLQESWTTRAEGGRGLHTTRLWDPESGLHLATTIQDGLVRFKGDAQLKL